jgi:flagella basal body P-ring formation protein FlgA
MSSMLTFLGRNRFLACFAIAAFNRFECFAGGLPVRFDLKQKVSVTGSHIYLSDIAKCSGDHERCRETSGIDLGLSPAAGRISYVTRTNVETILDKEWPAVAYEFFGAESTRIEALAVDIPSDELAKKLQDEISTRIQPIASEIRLSITRIQSMGFAHVRPTQIKFEFPELATMPWDQVDWVSRNLPGSRTIQVRAINPKDVDDKSLLNATVIFNVERLLPVLRRPLIAGNVISKNQLVMAWLPMRRGFQDFATEIDLIAGKKTRQAIGGGETVPLRYLDDPIAVMRNQPVSIVVRRGDLEIASKATTVDQGAVGQTVDVVNMVTKKRMRARVLDEKTVEAVAF